MKLKPIFNFPENTYNKAFLINALITGISAGLLLEYKHRDPLLLYRNEETPYDALHNISLTVGAGIAVTFLSYWVMRIVAGFGDSTLVI